MEEFFHFAAILLPVIIVWLSLGMFLKTTIGREALRISMSCAIAAVILLIYTIYFVEGYPMATLLYVSIGFGVIASLSFIIYAVEFLRNRYSSHPSKRH